MEISRNFRTNVMDAVDSKVTPNWPLLAGLRFVLAMVVVLQHLPGAFGVPHHIPDAGAFAAVLSFLVISGFSIRSSIEREPRAFLNRRIDRVYPAALASFVIALIPPLLFAFYNITPPVANVGELPTPLTIFSAGLLLTAYLPTFSSCGPSWTVSFEFSYYICALWFVKQTQTTMWRLTLLGLFSFAVGPSLGFQVLGYPWYTFIALLGFWLVGWQICGAKSERERLLCALLPCIAIGFQVRDHVILSASTMALTLLAITCGDAVPFAAAWKTLLVWLGDLSYPVYIVHWPALCLATTAFPHMNVAEAVGIVLLFSAAIHHLVEVPYKHWIKRRSTRRAADKFLSQPSVEAA